MTDIDLENLIKNTTEKLPDMLWERIKKTLAKDIALELIAKLDGQKAPSKQESINRTDEMIRNIEFSILKVG
jgi:hypothetical protein